MNLLNEITSHTNGAQFVRADLHIHSFGPGGSYDVKDAAMTPEAIVDAAIAENLKVIAIADHNVIGNVRNALKRAEGKDILVVPAVELSTQQGHLLVYCSTPDALEHFYAKLQITADKRFCQDTIPQCLKYAEEFEGFGILAHIDQEAGLEFAHPKFDAFKQDILNCKNLLAIEITSAEKGHWYSHLDDNPDRKNCAIVRREHLGHETDVHLAKVMGSDSHALNALGRNAQGNKRLTRFKMESPTFESLRIALLDCAARVRLEDLIPLGVPHFVGMKLEGGFLRDQVINFSPNLTCIIGGRGAGKSTMLESLRVCSGHITENSLIDSEVWPDCISLIYEDEVGQRHTLTRSKANDILNADANGPTCIGIESYGQGQTAETIKHCDKDPAILLKFLDGFIELAEIEAQDEELRNALLENQTEIERLQLEINRIQEIEKAKKLADNQVETLKKQKAGEVAELEQKLANGRVFRTKLQTNLSNLLTSISDGLTSDDLVTLIEEMDGTTLAVGKTELDTVKALMNGLAGDLDKMSKQLKENITATTEKITAQLTIWSAKEKQTKDRIEDLRRELEKQNIKLDMAFIRKVTKDATDFAQLLDTLKKSLPKQKEAFTKRRQLLADRRTLKSKMFTTRNAFATGVNSNLATCVVDYSVHLRFHEGSLSPALEEFVKEAMNWRTSQVPKAALIASHISPLNLVEAIVKKNTAVLEQILDQSKNKVFSRQDAQTVLDTLGQWKNRCILERCTFQDRPEIKVTKTVTLPDGKKAYPSRDFTQLSLGQQQSILLTILLFSKSKMPLVIDQPEDNLDSEFIYTTLVRSLRSIKEHRQVIIVTHNANITVLGDAELIIPLRGASDVSLIRDRGSIDTDKTKKMVCTILEGGERAFKRRQALYGF
ncbi:MAG: TrlF family AAA-like ATPase [Tepidisphaeraceae bacterium]|jgi:ABC-type Mn2+/Zn2+ transport system ATPase subunit/histidinol phosphatase-like PHP family hydrolase